ncbi:MAG: nuclear transport factor 2 family protein [Anaerolineae bacterium]
MHQTTPVGAVELVLAFNDALNQRDLASMMELMTEDCVFENTYPTPDGSRYVGMTAVRAFWANFFSQSSQSSFEVEEIFGEGERCVMRWTYRWVQQDGAPGHIRGVDVYRIRAGKISEKLSYVKG